MNKITYPSHAVVRAQSFSSLHKGNNERLRNVSQLEKELEDFLNKQAEQEVVQKSKPWNLSIKSFIGSNKSELMNIGACILFVGIAVQVTNNRNQSKRIIAQKIEQDEKMKDMKVILDRIGDDDLAIRIAQKCAEEIVSLKEDNVSTKDKSLLSMFQKKPKETDLTVEAQMFRDAMSPIIRTMIKNEIENVHLSKIEREDKEVEELQSMLSSAMTNDGKIGNISQEIKTNKEMNELQMEHEEIEVQGEGSSKVVRKRQFVM